MKKAINTRHAKHPVQSGVKTSACARFRGLISRRIRDGILRRRQRRPREGNKGLWILTKPNTSRRKLRRNPTFRAGRVSSVVGGFSGEGYIILPRQSKGWGGEQGVGLGDRCQNTVKRHVVNLRAESLRSRARDWPRRRKNVRKTTAASKASDRKRGPAEGRASEAL